MILDVVGIASHTQLVLPDEDDVRGESARRWLRPTKPNSCSYSPIIRANNLAFPWASSLGWNASAATRSTAWAARRSAISRCIASAAYPGKTHTGRSSPGRRQGPRGGVYALGREVGLVVPKLIDIRGLPTTVDTITLCEPGVIGSLVVDGKQHACWTCSS